jgi:N utilization substance protein B
MPKFNQHQIRQRAVQTIFSYNVQKEMAQTVVREFREYTEKLNEALTGPVRFDIDYQDERITVRKFPKKIAKRLEALAEIYEILGVENFEKTALAKALGFMRDFGGHAKKMTEIEATAFFTSFFANLKLVKLLTIDLEEEPVGPKIIEFIKALPENKNAVNSLETFKSTFSMLHENVLEKYTVELFTPETLQKELEEKLAAAEAAADAKITALLAQTKAFVLNYDNESNFELEAPEYFTTLVDGVLAKTTELEEKVSTFLAKNWSFSRLTLVEQAILEVSAYEILYTETPGVVAVNEAVELSKDFSDEKSSRFINGVLTNFLKKD